MGSASGRTAAWRKRFPGGFNREREDDWKMTMTAVPDRSTFESAYASQAPWDIGRPQKALLDVADRMSDPT